MALPKNYTDLLAACDKPQGTFVNLLGVVVDILQPTITAAGQHMFTFKLLDPRTRDSLYHSKGLSVRYFKPDVESLPKVRSIGDVVLLRSIKMTEYAGLKMAMANWSTEVLVFPGGGIPDPSFSIAFVGNQRVRCHGTEKVVATLTLQEQAYVIALKSELQSVIESIPPVEVSDPIPAKFSRPGNIENDRTFPGAATSNLAERKWPASGPLPSAPADKRIKQSSTFGAKFRLVSELQHMTFADVCVQVVKKFTDSYGHCDLYVTDYTANHDMWYYTPPEEDTEEERDGDMFGYSGGPPKRNFPGPYGWLVLKVNVKDPHAAFVNIMVKEGDMILIRNLKMKVRAEGAKLEGDMWPDSINPNKIQVEPLKVMLPEIEQLNHRKDKYWAAREKFNPAQQKDDPPPRLTKAEKKRKQQQEQEAAAAKTKEKKKKHADTPTATKDSDVNKNVRCGNQEVQTTSLKDILDAENLRHINILPDGRTYVMPFINAKYRARVQVVDYEPKLLEDFAVPASSDEDLEMSPIDTAYSASPRHEWFFSFTLEDARSVAQADETPERIMVHLQHEDAQFLLGNNLDDPNDLRGHPQLLARLREKLFVLWGNLEEKDEHAPLSNRPFECCIAEYGVEMDDDDPEKASTPFGWKKMFRMFQTTIL